MRIVASTTTAAAFSATIELIILSFVILETIHLTDLSIFRTLLYYMAMN